MRHDILLEWSDEDKIWVASVPDIPGLKAHGTTQQEATRSAIEAADAWIEHNRFSL